MTTIKIGIKQIFIQPIVSHFNCYYYLTDSMKMAYKSDPILPLANELLTQVALWDLLSAI